MLLSPLQLKTFYVRSFSLEVQEHFSREEETTGALTVNVRELAQNNEDANKWRVVVQVLLHESTEGALPPYSVAIEVEGYFEYLSPEPGDLEASRTVGVNGASVLFSAAREHVWMLTSRCRWGAFMLPTVDFRDLQVGPSAADVAAT